MSFYVMQKAFYMKTRRLIIIGFLIFIAFGRIMPMTLLPEPWDPWYISYTTIWFFAAGILFFPSGLFSQSIGLSFIDDKYLIVDAIWLIILCLIIYFISFPSTESQSENN